MGQTNSAAEDTDAGRAKDGGDEKLTRKFPEDFTKRFEVQEEIGKGAFGRVYKVIDIKTRSVYAAKHLRYDSSNLKEARVIF